MAISIPFAIIYFISVFIPSLFTNLAAILTLFWPLTQFPYVQNVFNELFDALEKKLTKLDTPTWLRWTREKTKNLPTIPKYLQRTLIIILLPLLAFPALKIVQTSLKYSMTAITPPATVSNCPPRVYPGSSNTAAIKLAQASLNWFYDHTNFGQSEKTQKQTHFPLATNGIFDENMFNAVIDFKIWDYKVFTTDHDEIIDSLTWHALHHC
jgi:hypothetical protein